MKFSPKSGMMSAGQIAF